jgi:hypothetical protein
MPTPQRMARKHTSLDEVAAGTRFAGPADNAALVELMAHVPMEGSLVLSTRRDPDFFALYDIQRGSHDVVYYPGEEFGGMGAFLVRSGYLDGTAQNVGYLGDLRTEGTGRGRAFFAPMYGRMFADVSARRGCASFCTAILADNAIALASLTKRAAPGSAASTSAVQPQAASAPLMDAHLHDATGAERATFDADVSQTETWAPVQAEPHASESVGARKRREKRALRHAMPHYALMRRYQMASIQLLAPPAFAPRPSSASAALVVASATRDDVEPLAAFLHEDHKTRPFGYRFDDGELEHRLARWPGFSLADTFVVRARSGEIVGCATAWDPAPVKRYRVLRYAGGMRALRIGMRVASAVVGCPPLPSIGHDFRTLYLTNLSIRGDDPLVLRALLAAMYPHAWKKRAHFLALPLWSEDDPHAHALGGYLVQRLAFHLYGVTAHDVARDVWPSGRPGFEIALA